MPAPFPLNCPVCGHSWSNHNQPDGCNVPEERKDGTFVPCGCKESDRYPIDGERGMKWAGDDLPLDKALLLNVALTAIAGASVAVGFGRLEIPGHDLSWPGTYEAFAHIWVGMLIVLCFVPRVRLFSFLGLVLLTVLEVLMFLDR